MPALDLSARHPLPLLEGKENTMKPKTVISLLAVVLILAAASYFLLKDPSNDNQNGLMGAKFAKDLPINEIASITIHSPEQTVELEKGPAVWQVKNRFGYPADFSKISDLLKKIKRLKVGRTFEADNDVLGRQKLYDPKGNKAEKDQKGIRITLADESNKTISDLILGESRQGNSQYIRHAAENTVYLVNDTFSFLEQDPANWLESEIINIDGQEVKAVNCYTQDSDKPLYSLQRPEIDKAPELVSPPEEGSVDSNKIDQVFQALSPLNLEDVSGPSRDKNADLPKVSAHLEYHLYDGKIISVYPSAAPGEKPEDSKYRVVLTAGYTQPETTPDLQTSEQGQEDEKNTNTDSKTAEDEDETGEKAPQSEAKSPEEVQKEALALNDKLKVWTFEIAKWQYDSFITTQEGLMEVKEESAP